MPGTPQKFELKPIPIPPTKNQSFKSTPSDLIDIGHGYVPT
jgi:hypothetical protein